MKLPELKGSEKQINWAFEVRDVMINNLTCFIKRAKLEFEYDRETISLAKYFLYILKHTTDCNFILNNRKITIGTFNLVYRFNDK